MSRPTQVLTRDAYGVTFADPLAPDYTVRFKTNKTVKGLNGVNVDNFVHEVIINDAHEISVGTVTANDPLSVRIRTSGSIESQVRLCAVLQQAADQQAAWIQENTLLGFEPTTVPQNPTVSDDV